MPRWLRYAVTACVLAWGAGLFWFLTLIPSHVPDDKVNADAIVVLTGGSERLEHGFELLAAGRAPKMLITGVEDSLTLPGLLRKKEFLSFAGRITPGSVELGHKAHSTVGNAEETAGWVAREHIRSILLVTGSYHIPRSVYELHAAMPDVSIIPEPVFPNHFATSNWWQFTGNIRLVLSEYHKYVTSVIVHTLLEKS